MLRTKRWIWASRAPSSKSLMVTLMWVLSKEMSWSHVASVNWAFHRNRCLLLSWNTPPIPVLEASVAPNQEGRKGLIFWR